MVVPFENASLFEALFHFDKVTITSIVGRRYWSNKGLVMSITVVEKSILSFRLSCIRDGEEVGRARLIFGENDLHKEPFGLLEDVFVLPEYRSDGVGRELLQKIFDLVREHHCYKLIATSRDDGSRKDVHDWYIRLGFQKYGTEFRINF